MSIQITLNFSSLTEAVNALIKLELPSQPLPTIEAPAPEVAAKPGKPKATRAEPAANADSPRTAEAAPSTPAPSDAAPEKKPEPSASAPSTAKDAAATSADEPAFEYATLQKAVNERVAKHGKAALLAIAEKHGAPNFKSLPASAWRAAHEDVIALGA